MTDETKAVLEEMAIQCEKDAASAKKGDEHYRGLRQYETAARFDGERNAWVQAAAMLRARAK